MANKPKLTEFELRALILAQAERIDQIMRHWEAPYLTAAQQLDDAEEAGTRLLALLKELRGRLKHKRR